MTDKARRPLFRSQSAREGVYSADCCRGRTMNPRLRRSLCPLIAVLLAAASLAPAVSADQEACRLDERGVPASLVAPAELRCVGRGENEKLRRRLGRCAARAAGACGEQAPLLLHKSCAYDKSAIAAPLLAGIDPCRRRICRKEARRARQRLEGLLAAGCRQSSPVDGPMCVDQCGDGVCAEVVCLAQGCPCAESKSSCAADCGEE